MSGIILFDGICNLCDRSVRFIYRHDPAGYFRFAPLQSEEAQRLLAEAGGAAPDLNTILLIEDGKVYDRSNAALRIARRLNKAWSMLYGGIVIPRPLRDLAYSYIARNRYRWFGQKEQCDLPPPGLRERFIAFSD